MGFLCGSCCGGARSGKAALFMAVVGTLALGAAAGGRALLGKEMDAEALMPLGFILVAIWTVSGVHGVRWLLAKRAVTRAAQSAQSEAVKPGRAISEDDAR